MAACPYPLLAACHIGGIEILTAAIEYAHGPRPCGFPGTPVFPIRTRPKLASMKYRAILEKAKRKNSAWPSFPVLESTVGYQ